MADEFEEYKTTDTLKETDRKCPQCGGTMDFNPSTGGLKCPYCDYEEAIPEEVNNEEGEVTKATELPFDDATITENYDWGTETKTIICKSCGAESVYNAQVISSECPYCGSNQVTEAGDNSKVMAPGGVVPFKIDQKSAAERFKTWIKKRFFCPKKAKESANPKKFKGMYLPYWTFDADTDSVYTAEWGRDRKVKRGDHEEIVTDWHRTEGSISEFFNDELVCGTSNESANLLKGVEPFDTEDNKAYKPEYVAGFGAEKYSIGVRDAWKSAEVSIKSKIKNSIQSEVTGRHNADRVRNINFNTRFSNRTYKYLLLPIWISSYKYKDKVYNFVVNGQTGKVSGKTPISALRVAIVVVIAIILIALFFYLQQ